ncbi:MAG: YceI family protein, partial [Actinobacteria bacterium]|nr:YceI family protein [Actinomycetota bacterium]
MARPAASRRRPVLVAAVLIPIAVIAAGYFLFFTPSSPDRLGVSAGGDGAPSSTPVPLSGDVDGTWKASPESVVGYRVRERLARLPASSDAVGRTNAVVGSVTLKRQGETIIASDTNFTADLTQLKSDEARRDSRMRSVGIETERFPSATFVAASPIELPATALSGAVTKVQVPGDLTIHGVTKRVTMPLEAKTSGSQIEVAGTLTFPFGDFGMSAPNVGGIVTVESNPT